MSAGLLRKLFIYQTTTVVGVLFALMGFSYNVWRMEISETNNNVRTASFEMLSELSALEQLIYIAAYDGDLKEGSPRKGWVKVGLIEDLSILTAESVEMKSAALKEVWSEHWSSITDSNESVQIIVRSIDSVRLEIKTVLSSLK